MKSNFRKTFLFFAVFYAALFMASCETPEQSRGAQESNTYYFPANPENGIALVRIPSPESAGADTNASVMRTAIPDFGDTKFVYLLSAESEGEEPVAQPVTPGTEVPLELKSAAWTITVKAYKTSVADTNLALQGSAGVNVFAGKTAELTIGLRPVTADAEGGIFSGTLDYTVNFTSDSISYPGDINYALLNVFPPEGGAPVKTIDVWNTAKADGANKKASGTVALDAGYYRVTLELNRNDGGTQKYAGKTDVLHIYKDTVTPAAYTFTADEFSALIPSGTGNRTFTTILGTGTSALQKAMTVFPQNTIDTPYIIAVKTAKIDNSDSRLGNADDPLSKLIAVLNGRYVTVDFTKCGTGTTIPNATSDGAGMRVYGDRITTVVLPDTVTSIGDYAFAYLYSLRQIVLPSSLQSIGKNAFYSCSSLCFVKLPNNLNSIGDNAFANSSIEVFDIPAGISSLGGSSLASKKLKTLILRKSDAIVSATSEPPPVGTFLAPTNPNRNDIKFYVPSTLLEAYKADTVWSGLRSSFITDIGKEELFFAIPDGM